MRARVGTKHKQKAKSKVAWGVGVGGVDKLFAKVESQNLKVDFDFANSKTKTLFKL